MVDEDKLSAGLSEFARTLATEVPMQRILDHLVEQVVGILPVTSAGVTLIGEGRVPRFVAASDPHALRHEQLQTRIGEGPCVLSCDSGEPVAMADLATDGRFPAFTSAARDAGLGAVFTFPLHHGDLRLGALDLYRETPGGLDEHTMGAAQTLADVAAAYLINAQARDDARVTESILMDDAERAQAVLDELRETGVRIALDDFGTGFSSLSYLQPVPADIIKIDRSFVAGIDATSNRGAILTAMTDLDHVLSLVTAEGVETCGEHDEVGIIGCEFAHGHYARPMPATAIDELLAEPCHGAGHLPRNGWPPPAAGVIDGRSAMTGGPRGNSSDRAR